MRMRLFMVLAARATEEEQNRLGVFGSHTASFRCWPVVVKRSIVFPYEWRGHDCPSLNSVGHSQSSAILRVALDG